jgi:hypothetical protein
MGRRRDVNRVLVEKPEGKRPLGRPRNIFDDNIKMDFQKIAWWRGAWAGLFWLSKRSDCGHL